MRTYVAQRVAQVELLPCITSIYRWDIFIDKVQACSLNTFFSRLSLSLLSRKSLFVAEKHTQHTFLNGYSRSMKYLVVEVLYYKHLDVVCISPICKWIYELFPLDVTSIKRTYCTDKRLFSRHKYIKICLTYLCERKNNKTVKGHSTTWTTRRTSSGTCK